ncbi:MAG: 3-deoxy-D-manno-octulosonic acid transferase [Paracoccus sp. (in: a-proteobacteria)]|uniref:3-deoxy-D-manno-octulosonic acid transferase n=1 Tax=Paracoccus sp. TaxID=267 RepID=UPI0026E099CF|nr:3-deoxy-D-manno-octulosonic acid transferase [Paracoccus sp. (in: a-proteobacteria)]MDO5621214.1 3-deoxy-D-manno-octulosonic acid transferase [Paracoccus sp. (in: a-proteobacteria)]
MSVAGSLALWWHLRRHAGTVDLGIIRVPAGNDPLIWLHIGQGGLPALDQVIEALHEASPTRLRLAVSGVDQLPEGCTALPNPGQDRRAVQHILNTLRPSAVLTLGACMNMALAAETQDMGVPLVLAELRCPRDLPGMAIWQRQLAAGLAAVLATDDGSADLLNRLGVPSDKITVTGPVSDLREPPSCLEAERAVLAGQLSRRMVWLAAALPQSEEAAFLTAHQAALRYNHRALAIVLPADPARAPELAQWLEAEGLAVAERARDEEPEPEIQVLIADDPAEYGLWYRLASVCYMGGTLSGDDAATRHPFEPAALGSATLHGPHMRKFQTAWAQLDGGNGARRVADAQALAEGLTELAAPDQAARLATNAWGIATGGAAAARQIARTTLAAIKGPTI